VGAKPGLGDGLGELGAMEHVVEFVEQGAACNELNRFLAGVGNNLAGQPLPKERRNQRIRLDDPARPPAHAARALRRARRTASISF
jgi:hypothetical protein